MKIYAHRGHVDGPCPALSNHPNAVDFALNLGYGAEVDLWFVRGKFYLGHDDPEHRISETWLKDRSPELLIHAKTVYALKAAMVLKLDVFCNDRDPFTISSHGKVMVHPDGWLTEDCYCIMPEARLKRIGLSKCAGIVTDFAEHYDRRYNMEGDG